jgi:hypothetical protein
MPRNDIRLCRYRPNRNLDLKRAHGIRSKHLSNGPACDALNRFIKLYPEAPTPNLSAIEPPRQHDEPKPIRLFRTARGIRPVMIEHARHRDSRAWLQIVGECCHGC